MSVLVRCPQCDTFVKPISLDAGSCPFCPSPQARSSRNPLPGLVLAATMAAVPSCSGGDHDDVRPVYGISPADARVGTDGAVYGIAIDASGPDATAPDAGPVYGIAVDASSSDAGDSDAGIQIYGVAPEPE